MIGIDNIYIINLYIKKYSFFKTDSEMFKTNDVSEYVIKI